MLLSYFPCSSASSSEFWSVGSQKYSTFSSCLKIISSSFCGSFFSMGFSVWSTEFLVSAKSLRIYCYSSFFFCFLSFSLSLFFSLKFYVFSVFFKGRSSSYSTMVGSLFTAGSKVYISFFSSFSLTISIGSWIYISFSSYFS